MRPLPGRAPLTARLARLQALGENVRGSLGFLPAVGVAVAVVAGIALPAWERGRSDTGSVPWFVFGGGADAARSVLSSISSSVITVTSLTFSLTFVTLQLASSQFSPRLLRTFVRDRLVQSVLAVFLATFVYSLVVLRTIRTDTDSDPGFVPRVAVTAAILLAIGSAGALVAFLAHIASLMRIDTLMREVHEQTGAALARLYPPDEDRPPTLPDGQGRSTVRLDARRSGWVQAVDTEALREAAERLGLVVRLDAGVGDHVVEGMPMGLAWHVAPSASVPVGDPGSVLDRVVTVGFERTPQFDAAFGLRQLVDIAARALSPGVNDPTTAVHALGHLAAVLHGLARRPLGPRALADDEGRVRVVVRRPDFPELLDLACAQPRQFGAGQPAVVDALLGVLESAAHALGPDGDPARRAAVLLQLEQAEEAAEREVSDPRDLAAPRQRAARVRALLATPVGLADGSRRGELAS